AFASKDDNLIKLQSYRAYLEQHADKKAGNADIAIMANTYSNAEGDLKALDHFEGMEVKSVLTGENGKIEWEINVPESGMYNIELLYYPIDGKGNSIERMISIDGKVPYNEAKYINLS